MAYALNERQWTHADFEHMGWHDATIHAVAHLPETWEFAVDLDYIVEWIAPRAEDGHYRFWIAPATLIFENAREIQIDLTPTDEISVQELKREGPFASRKGFVGPSSQWRWVLDCNQGEITLSATGFRQILRRSPIQTQQQTLTLDERGGISFGRDPFSSAERSK